MAGEADRLGNAPGLAAVVRNTIANPPSSGKPLIGEGDMAVSGIKHRYQPAIPKTADIGKRLIPSCAGIPADIDEILGTGPALRFGRCR